MTQRTEEFIHKIPIIRQLIQLLDRITLPWLYGLSFYELIAFYIRGIFENAVSNRAASIAFSFFMALFPFALFIFNLIPFIPIEGFQTDFMEFVQESVPPTTFEAISKIVDDILHHSHSGLLSIGFFMSVFLMTNGVNAILIGFESSSHVRIKRKFIRQYLVALGISMLLSLLLLITVAAIIVFEIFIQKIKIQDVLSEDIPLIQMGRYAFVILMILLTTSILFKYGIKRDKRRSFISIGSVFTTLLIIGTSYLFGIWVVKFSKYNELYGSIGTLLVVMFYIWVNCAILLLGFELNGTINTLKYREELKKQNKETL